jgi:hypothetical protein
MFLIAFMMTTFNVSFLSGLLAVVAEREQLTVALLLNGRHAHLGRLQLPSAAPLGISYGLEDLCDATKTARKA